MPESILETALTPDLRAAGAQFAYVFGSRARGEHRPDSDLDLAVHGIRDLDLIARAGLAGRLADVAGVEEVDLVLLEDASLELQAKIIREGSLVYSSDEPARVAFQVRTLGQFFDFEPTLREHERRLIEQFAERGLA